MDEIVKVAKESHDFHKTFTRHRDLNKPTDVDAPSVFNKRLFVSRNSIVITKEATKIMEQNLRQLETRTRSPLTKTELRVMNNVVEGLKLIHKGQEHVKEALSGIVTCETVEAHEYVTHSADEEHSACYYVINGAVEVTYAMNTGQSRSVYEPNILYNHSTGEYIGLVSPEGIGDDLTPPATIYTREISHFIKINRLRFHEEVKKLVKLLTYEKRIFMSGGSCKLSIPDDVTEKILDKLSKREYPSNTIILQQDDLAEEMFLIVSGRCQLSRDILLANSQKKVKVMVGIKQPGDFFGEECILERKGSYCEVKASSHTVCYKLHRSALEIVQRESLRNIIEGLRNEYPEDCDLSELGHRSCIWNYYKHKQVKSTLEEHGKLRYMFAPDAKRIKHRPPSTEIQYRDNLLRFIEKGAHYKMSNSRVQSAMVTKSTNRIIIPPRAGTVLGNVMSDRDVNEDVDDGITGISDEKEEPITSDKFPLEISNILDKQLSKQKFKKITRTRNEKGGNKEFAKLLSEDADLGRRLKIAWEDYEEANTGFTKTGVLATMTTEDIVRKAKALAEKQSEHSGGTDDHGEEWHTVLHEENQSAKINIAASKYRVAILRRKMNALAKKRQKENSKKPINTLQNEKDKLSYHNYSERPSCVEDEPSLQNDGNRNNVKSALQRLACAVKQTAIINEFKNRSSFKPPVTGVSTEHTEQRLESKPCAPAIDDHGFKEFQYHKGMTMIKPEHLKNDDDDTNHVRFTTTVQRRPHSTSVMSKKKRSERPKTAIATGSNYRSVSSLINKKVSFQQPIRQNISTMKPGQ